MALYLDTPKKTNFGWIGILALIILVLLLSNYPEWELRYRNSKVVTLPSPSQFKSKEVTIAKGEANDDSGHSRIFQHPFGQIASTSGRSRDELVIRFDAPVEILGIVASVDCWKSTRLVEFAGGINQKPAYQTNGPNDMLFHVSFATNHEAGKIDEQFWFPKPFSLKTTDSINIGAWIQNVTSQTQNVSPEFIVYYSWIEPPQQTWRPRKIWNQ